MNADALAAAKAAVRPLSLKELRLQLRARGLTPAGGLDTLRARLEEHMAETGDCSIKAELAQPHPADAAATYGSSLLSGGNYKSGGQLLQASSPAAAPSQSARRHFPSAATAAPFSTDANSVSADRSGRAASNNYARPAGQQNVGNYLTGRPSSRVLAPPGGTTSIVFGDDGGSCAAAPRPAAPAPYAVEQEEGEETTAGEQEEEAAEAAAEEEASFEAPAAPPVPDAPTARVNFGVSGIGQGHAAKGASSSAEHTNNNYMRSEGQNVGNFLSGRPTSRVLAPPGGKSSITFG